MTDDEADQLLTAVLDLAVAVRDYGVDTTGPTAAGIVARYGPTAALIAAACAIRVDQPLDRWWTTPPPTRTCSRCGRPMVNRARRGPQPDRDPGTVIHHSRGLCNGCRSTTRNTVTSTHDTPSGRPRNDRDQTVDPVAVERAVTGDTPIPRLTHAERRAAIHHLVAEGWSTVRIAGRLGLAARTVDHIRAEQKAGAA